MSGQSEHVSLSAGHAYEITTEHGSKLYVDRRGGRSRWLRIPAPDRAGNLVIDLDHDLMWQRLVMLEPLGGPLPGEWDDAAGDDDFLCLVRIADPATLYTGLTEWWSTTNVVSVRELEDDEVPFVQSYDDDEVDLLDDQSEPGGYVVATVSGSRYVVTIDADRPVTIQRIGATELFADGEVMQARGVRFQVGRDGEYWYWKSDPADRTTGPDEAYMGTLRQSTTVLSILKQRDYSTQG